VWTVLITRSTRLQSCVLHAQRVDATENNVGILRDIVRGVKPDGRQLDEYVPGKMQRDMDRLMNLCGGVVIRD
jgi:hypothetical protein